MNSQILGEYTLSQKRHMLYPKIVIFDGESDEDDNVEKILH